MKNVIYHQFRSRPKKHFPPFTSVYCIEYFDSKLTEKEYGTRLAVVQGYDKEKTYAMVEGGMKQKELGKILLKKFSNPNYLAELIKWSESKTNSLRDYLDFNFPTQKLRNISNVKFIKNYNKFVSLYRLFHVKNTPPWWIGADVVEIELKKNINNGKYKETEKIFQTLTSGSEYPTEGFLEELSLLNICDLLSKSNIQSVKKSIDMPVKIHRLFTKHTKEFYSMPFGYNTEVLLGEKHFIREINNILKEKEIPSEIKKIKLLSINKQIKEREKFEKKYKLSKKIINLAKILRQLAYLQDLKKTTQTRSHPRLFNLVFKEISRRTGLEKKHYGYLSHFDIELILKQGKVFPKQKKEFNERLKTCVIILKNLDYIWLYKEDAIQFLTEAGAIIPKSGKIKSLKGIAASRGRVRGLIKTCLYSTEIKKVKKGDILVASMTTPDFVPAMKRAVAIITDEGGITCHAAIVAREMNKPCIIGTKIATKVLKDGDLVEVDANKGIIKILK